MKKAKYPAPSKPKGMGKIRTITKCKKVSPPPKGPY